MRLITQLKRIAVFLPLAILAFLVLAGTSECETENTENPTERRKEQIETRWDSFRRAEAMYPMPIVDDFPMRESLVKYTVDEAKRMPWYIYVLGDNGNIIGYYVGQTMPQSTCNFLSSTEDVVDRDDSELVLTAPSLDGIYYGGSGASSACAMSFFYDYATNSLIIVPSIRLFVTTAPLRVQADPIEVATGTAPP